MRSGAVDDADLVRVAAGNNAQLCDLVSRAHGAVGRFEADAWTCARRTPPLYPDAVTLDPGAEVAQVLARIDASAGASVKDSFAVLDLAPASFRVLFAADWIVRSPGRGVRTSPLEWSRVVDPDGLRAWERGWGEVGGTFRPALLDELIVLRGDLDGVLVAGAVVHRSETVVGVSNFFVSTVDPEVAWSGLLDDLARRAPGFAIVGYESGAALDVAHLAGFRSIGAMRVWIRE